MANGTRDNINNKLLQGYRIRGIEKEGKWEKEGLQAVPVLSK